jgi:hypothetical protein
MVQMKKLVGEKNAQVDVCSVKLRESVQGEEQCAGIVVRNFPVETKQ